MLSDSFFFQVLRMRKVIFRKTAMLLTEEGMQLQIEQLPILVILQKKGTLSQRELSDMTMRDKSSILRSVIALQKKGLLLIEQDILDKRKNNIDLSAEGTELAKKIGILMRKAEHDALSVFSDEERKNVFQTMKEYADRLEGV